MSRLSTAFALVIACSTCIAGEISQIEKFDLSVFELVQDQTRVRIAPAAGMNVYSIQVQGVEFLHQPESQEKIAGVACGVPILYPTPNRVKGGQFTFNGTQVKLEPVNGRGNHIHGLVNRHNWQVVNQSATAKSATITCAADFSLDNELSKRFPFPHVLLVTIEVTENRVRWTYEVDNSGNQNAVPFGFALHPYFRYQGAREETYLTIPATHWMESEAQLPSGKLIPASDLDFALNRPLSLKNTRFDDVFWGTQSDKPTIVEFRDVKRQLKIVASDEFTHLVVWTPPRSFFGVESQTCSTDSHNLYSQGFEQAAHLQICDPGKRTTGWVEFQFQID